MTQKNWQTLLAHSIRPGRSVLSVYLNVDQSQQANLNRGFETQFKDMMSSVEETIQDPAELERFRKAEHRLTDFLRVYQGEARTLAMFFDESDGSFWNQELKIPMQNLVRWDRTFFLKPLAAATDDFERYGILLLDRANARLFTVFLGGIEEVAGERFDPAKVRHIKTVGTDHWESASQVQKKADEQIRRNLRQAVRDLDSMVTSRHIDRLILAGTREIVAELRNLLPKRLALRVIGELDMDVSAPSKEVLAATLPLTEKYERDSEEQLVRDLATSAAKNRKAVVGLSNTLKKVNEARVWQLIFSEDFHYPGFECSKCAALFSIQGASCRYCGSSLVRVSDVVEKTVERALRDEARIEIVRSEAAAALDSAGGIGAFLKARTRTVEL
jgi:peptide subunit release factor 1 (eRF1)